MALSIAEIWSASKPCLKPNVYHLHSDLYSHEDRKHTQAKRQRLIRPVFRNVKPAMTQHTTLASKTAAMRRIDRPKSVRRLFGLEAGSAMVVDRVVKNRSVCILSRDKNSGTTDLDIRSQWFYSINMGICSRLLERQIIRRMRRAEQSMESRDMYCLVSAASL